eukprot:2581855-Pyramimonas_sp.AAC.1
MSVSAGASSTMVNPRFGDAPVVVGGGPVGDAGVLESALPLAAGGSGAICCIVATMCESVTDCSRSAAAIGPVDAVIASATAADRPRTISDAHGGGGSWLKLDQ